MKLKIFHLVAIFLFVFVSLSFAFTVTNQPIYVMVFNGWTSVIALTLVISTIFLALIYAIGFAFNLNDLKFLANEEFYQLIVTLIMVAAFFGSQNILNTFSRDFISVTAPTLQDAAINMVIANQNTHQTVYNNLKTFAVALGEASSKTYFCSLQGVGFRVNACGSFSSLSSPISIAFQMLSVSITEINSLQTLLLIAKNYGFTILLPFGILLRTVKLTRGAGGLFIGLAISLYLVLPLMVIFMDTLVTPPPLGSGYVPSFAPNLNAQLVAPECDETQFGTNAGGVNYDNYNNAVSSFNSLATNIKTYTYYFLIKGTMTTIVSLLGFFAAFRAIAKLAGTEVDISALARIA